MAAGELKLKQASAVLGVPPKTLQNLVQFRVLRPRRRRGLYWFDRRALLQAKVALYLKEALGASTTYVARFTDALSHMADLEAGTRDTVSVRSRPRKDTPAVEVTIPLRALAREVEARRPLGQLVRDLPRGRKRAGWKREFLRTLRLAAGDLAHVTQPDMARAVKRARRVNRTRPEVTVVAQSETTIA